MKPVVRIVGVGLLNDMMRVVMDYIEDLQGEVRRNQIGSSHGVNVNRTAIGTTLNAKKVAESTGDTTEGGPARWS